jgi:predicted enzyme related to lactoylglutathione lyase
MSNSDQKIDYVELPAADLDAVEAFYAASFGWTFTNFGPEYRAFSDGRMAGGFFASQLRSTAEAGGALIVLFADDLEAMRSRIVSNGGKICREFFDFPGGRRFHFTDPNGNELAVWCDH